MVLAFVLSVAFNFGTYFFSDKLALRMYNAQPVTREELPRAYAAVERLTAKQGLPMPKIYVLPTESPECVCYGAESATCFGGGHTWDFAVAG